MLLSLCCLLTSQTFAQANRTSNYHLVGWYTYNGDHKLAWRWALHTEYPWRRIDFIRSRQQSLARVSLVYSLSSGVKVFGGYTNFITYPYGQYPSADQGEPVPEHRINQKIELADQYAQLELSHRFRLEQRWLGQLSEENPANVASWESQNRIRYQISLTYPLRGPTIDDGEFYLIAFDELFIGSGSNVGSNIYNYNRISGGIGYQIQDNFKVD